MPHLQDAAEPDEAGRMSQCIRCRGSATATYRVTSAAYWPVALCEECVDHIRALRIPVTPDPVGLPSPSRASVPERKAGTGMEGSPAEPGAAALNQSAEAEAAGIG
jgi:hypothetical protein